MFKDLTGTKLGYLKILSIKENSLKRRSWLCECVCGKKLIMGEHLLLGNKSRNPNRSCGCMQLTQKGYSQTQPRLYGAWQSMIHRCHNPKNNNYHKYGAKGITVCDTWRNSIEPFFEWAIENGYKENLTLDRIDSTGDYSPNNCRWADYSVQAINQKLDERNTTGYKGVCSHPSGQYRAYISRKGVTLNLGMHKDLMGAVKVRQDAEEYYEQYGKLPERTI